MYRYAFTVYVVFFYFLKNIFRSEIPKLDKKSIERRPAHQTLKQPSPPSARAPNRMCQNEEGDFAQKTLQLTGFRKSLRE